MTDSMREKHHAILDKYDDGVLPTNRADILDAMSAAATQAREEALEEAAVKIENGTWMNATAFAEVVRSLKSTPAGREKKCLHVWQIRPNGRYQCNTCATWDQQPTPTNPNSWRDGEWRAVPSARVLFDMNGTPIDWSVISENNVCIAAELHEYAAKAIAEDHNRAAKEKQT